MACAYSARASSSLPRATIPASGSTRLQGVAMHRGLGVYIRGTEGGNRALGTLAAPRTFGHGGAGSSQSWADPDSGLSFTYLSNLRHGAWHDQRMDKLSNLVHAALVEP